MNQVGEGGMLSIFDGVRISVSSRDDDPSEIAELNAFVKRCIFRGVLHYITSVFYDSNASLATICVADSVRVGDVVSVTISEIAKETLSQFIDMDGTVQGNYGPEFEDVPPVAHHLLN